MPLIKPCITLGFVGISLQSQKFKIHEEPNDITPIMAHDISVIFHFFFI